MSAVRDYQETRTRSLYAVTALTIALAADAAIAELEATLDEAQAMLRLAVLLLPKDIQGTYYLGSSTEGEK